jgi:CRISPR-associated protein Csx17
VPELPLFGCTPEPLMNYLKALGVLRLVSEQADPNARGRWCGDVFALDSKLDPDGLRDFFLDQYKPTPIVAPWGARSGFYAGSSERAARGALEEVMKSEQPRFGPFRDLVERVRSLLREMGLSDKARDEAKLELLVACRSRLPDAITSWLDTCYVLLGDERRFPPLLGTGGNEGSGSYVSGFAQQVVACLLKRNHDSALLTALFAVSEPYSSTDQTPGHFSGLAAGGANATQGFEAEARTNPWDYLLCLEGTCLWASGAVRRLSETGPRMAAFPFTVNVSSVGSGSLVLSDGAKPKRAKRDIAEIWLPIWPRWVALPELRALLAEGRITVGRRAAVAGIDAARAISGLGVNRGITVFQRNVFLMRNGQSFLAVSAGSMAAKRREAVDLLVGIDPWLARFRRACSDERAPVRFKLALRGIDQAIFDFCRYGGHGFIQAVLRALGRAERELAVHEGDVTSTGHCDPLGGLSADWLHAANDGTPEFEVALALAGMFDPDGKIAPLRANLEPVITRLNRKGNLSAKWPGDLPGADHELLPDRAVVWNSGNVAMNLAHVLARRMMDGNRMGCENLPLTSRNFVSLGTVSRFLASELDEHRIEELLWGLMLVEQKDRIVRPLALPVDAPPLPRAYALLKLLFLPQTIDIAGQAHAVKPEAAIPTLLCSDRVGEACSLAMRRLCASGLILVPQRTSGGLTRDADWHELNGLNRNGHRLAAALLLPVGGPAITQLRLLVTRASEEEM